MKEAGCRDGRQAECTGALRRRARIALGQVLPILHRRHRAVEADSLIGPPCRHMRVIEARIDVRIAKTFGAEALRHVAIHDVALPRPAASGCTALLSMWP